MKIYLVGELYDDFQDEGFNILAIASNLKNAKKMSNYYADQEKDIQIREWSIDELNPIGEIVDGSFEWKDENGEGKLKFNTVLPYKIIKDKTE